MPSSRFELLGEFVRDALGRPAARPVALAGLCAVALACQSKSLRDETVFTGASAPARLGDAPSTPALPTGTGTPVVRSPLQASGTPSGQAKPPKPSPGSGGKVDPDAGPDNPGNGSARPSARNDAGALPEPEPDTPVSAEPSPEPGPAPVEPEPQPDAPAPPEFSKQALIEEIGACSLQLYDHFRGEATALADAAAANAASPTPEGWLAVQQGWVAAQLSWQRAELFRFGPAATPGEPGGRGLRDHIYAWNRNPPGNNRCRIETALATRSYAEAGFTDGLVVVRTLSALEFLAFHASLDTACTSFDDIVAQGTWAALDAAELERRRAEYASVVATDVAARAAELYRAWSPQGDDFLGTFTSPGNATFPTEQSVLDAVSSGLFYLDLDVKDFKVGMPLALVPECPKASCPEAFESQYARASTLLLYENLNGFEELFAGCGADPAALGFDDWLLAVGGEDLATRMQAAVDHAQLVVATLDPPLEDALLADASKVSAVHQAIKAITDLLKTEFVTLLDLELPSSVATDND